MVTAQPTSLYTGERYLHTIHLFGQSHIQYGDDPIDTLPAKAQELLFYLLLHQDYPHTREFLASHLWPEAPSAQAKKYLRQAVWQIQSTLDQPDHTGQAALLLLDREWVRLNPAASLWLDTRMFEQSFALVRDLDGRDLDLQQAQTLQSAVELYQGDLLLGWYQDWCLIARERFQSMLLAMLDKLINYCLCHGQFERGIAYGMRALRHEPTREKTHRQLMRLYYLAGDRTAALRQFNQCVTILENEFGVTPTHQTLHLWEQIRADQLEVDPPATHVDLPIQRPAEQLPMRILTELNQIMTTLTRLQYEVELIKHIVENRPPR